MSLSSAQLLTVAEALHDKCALATNVDFVFPTATRFTDKGDYWAFVDSTNNTKSEIETTLIRAVWINYLRFEDDNQETDHPIKKIFYEFTVFTESTFERLDETATPNAFNAKVAKQDHEHDTSVFDLQAQFLGISPLGLDVSQFAVSETVSLTQTDVTQRLVPCDFIADSQCFGSQTRLQCQANIQINC